MSKFFLIDLDGTMFHGTKIIKEAKIFLDECIKNNQDFLFLTNNASRTPEQAAKHMMDIGYENIEPRHFYTSAMAAVDTVAKTSDLRKAYFIGQDGLKNALLEKGFIIDENKPDFLFVGMNKSGNYDLYSKGLRMLLGNAKLIATNDDRMLSTENGMCIGNGSIVALLEYASSQKAMKIGKPHQPIVDCVLDHINKTPDEVVIIGDNLETDILCGINGNIESILVTTGVHKRSDCDKLNIYPNRIVDSLIELL